MFVLTTETKSPQVRLRLPRLGRSLMWLNIWAVTIAMAIGFAVLAQAVQLGNNRATRGR